MEEEEVLRGGVLPDKNEEIEYFQRDFIKAMGHIEFSRFEGDDSRARFQGHNDISDIYESQKMER